MSAWKAVVRLCAVALLAVMVVLSHQHSSLAALPVASHECREGVGHRHQADGGGAVCCESTRCCWSYPNAVAVREASAARQARQPIPDIRKPFLFTRALYPPPKITTFFEDASI